MVEVPSKSAIVYRVSYRRQGWKEGNWKNKLFNSEGAATKYAAALQAPQKPDADPKYAKLKPIDALEISFGVVRWAPLDGADLLAHSRLVDREPTAAALKQCPDGYALINGECFELPDD